MLTNNYEVDKKLEMQIMSKQITIKPELNIVADLACLVTLCYFVFSTPLPAQIKRGPKKM